MTQEVSGNIQGLSSSEREQLERLYSQQVDSTELVSLSLAQELYQLAERLRRRVGVLLSREGTVEEVFIGTKDLLYLPDLGRYRLGHGRLRRLRLVFSDLSRASEDPQAKIPHDIYVDLEKLRLDAVVALRAAGGKLCLSYAYLQLPGGSADDHGSASQGLGLLAARSHTEHVADLENLSLNFSELISEIESDLARATKAAHQGTGIGAVLVGVYPRSAAVAQSSMDELQELARTAGLRVLDCFIQRKEPDPKTLVGTGKLEQLVLHCLGLGAEMVVFDGELRPAQWRSITNATELKVIDRSMLILDIFAQRATSSEGRVQVELAQLRYNLPKLVEKDAGLSRLSGGIGGRGPGETKLEIGRRRIRDRIAELEKKIGKLGEQRGLRGSRRVAQSVPLVALLGYTNVGKSTLFNALTRSSVLVEDKLFATLDPAQRSIKMFSEAHDYVAEPGFVSELILSDTVGFIRDLPEELRSAFRATLDDLHQAQLLVHVLDVSDPEMPHRKQAVERLLEEMQLGDKPTLLVFNKADRCSAEELAERTLGYEGLTLSALKREGLNELRQKILSILAQIRKQRSVKQEAQQRADELSRLGDGE